VRTCVLTSSGRAEGSAFDFGVAILCSAGIRFLILANQSLLESELLF